MAARRKFEILKFRKVTAQYSKRAKISQFQIAEIISHKPQIVIWNKIDFWPKFPSILVGSSYNDSNLPFTVHLNFYYLNISLTEIDVNFPQNYGQDYYKR